MSARVKLDNRERGYYASLYQAADALNSGQIGGAQAVGFFKRSGLPIEILKKIWLMSSPNNQTLNKEEFYIALKLISYAQNNIDVSLESITRAIPSPLPQFQSDTEEVYRLRPEQERLYQNYVQSLDHANHTVSTQLAMNLFQKTPLSSFQLQNIISLIDSQLQTKPRMTTHQYIVVAHLISLASQGVAIPQKLPHSLQEFLNSEVIPPQPKPIPVIPKSNDLMDFEAKFDKAKSPVDKYSAFKNLDISAAETDPPTLIQTQPSHLVTSQSFKVQSTSSQGPALRQQKSIDLMMSDLDGNSQQPVIAPIQPIQQPILQQVQQQTLQQQTLKQQVDFSKQVMIQEQIQLQQQQFEASLRQTNELLNEFREQHEKMLISTQSQLESLQTANEQYKTILKKISDENDLFQEELKSIEIQKKKLTENLSRQAVEINQKLGFNIQLKQEYTKQSMSGMNAINDLANTIIGDFKSQYEIEQERKRKADQEMIKELKGQKESIQHLSEQVNLLVKDMKSQRKNSVPYTAIDTHETEQINIQQSFLPPINSTLVSFQKGGESKKLFDDVNHQAFTEFQIPQQFPEVKIDNLLTIEKTEQIEEPKQQVDLFTQDLHTQQPFIQQEAQQLVFQNDLLIQPVNPIEFNVAASVSPKNLIETTVEQQQQNDDQIPEIQEEKHELEHNEPKITFDEHHQQDFNFKFEDDFNNRESTDKDQHQRDSVDIEQNPSLTFDHQFGQTITFGFGQTKANEVQIEFDANKEFGAEWTGFADNFAKQQSPQQQDDFTGFKW